MLHLKEHPYLSLASGSSMCSVNTLLMTSKAVGTGMLVNKAETSKETNSSSPLIFHSPEVVTEALAVLDK